MHKSLRSNAFILIRWPKSFMLLPNMISLAFYYLPFPNSFPFLFSNTCSWPDKNSNTHRYLSCTAEIEVIECFNRASMISSLVDIIDKRNKSLLTAPIVVGTSGEQKARCLLAEYYGIWQRNNLFCWIKSMGSQQFSSVFITHSLAHVISHSSWLLLQASIFLLEVSYL